MITIEYLFAAKNREAVRFLLQLLGEGSVSIKHPSLDVETFPRASKRVGMANVILFSDEHLNNHWYYIQVTKLIDGYYLSNKEFFNPRDMPDVLKVKQLIDTKKLVFNLTSNSNQVDGLIFSQCRPYHYFYDQFVNYFKLSSFKNIDDYCFTDETCFYSQTPSMSFKSIVKPGCYFFPCTLPGNYHDNDAKKMHDFLKNNAEVKHLKSDFTLWIGITGQKRSWVEQVDGYIEIIKNLSDMYSSITIIVDGWTNYVNDSSFNIEDNEVYDLIREKFTSNEDINFINLINKGYMSKVSYANNCDCFIANSGTGCMVPLLFSNIKGVIHGNGVLNTFKKIYNDNVYLVPKNKIISQQSKVIMVNSYSISWQVIFNLLMKVIGNKKQLNEPTQKMNSKLVFGNLSFSDTTKPADALRDIALAFEALGDKEMAYTLMCKALEQRPTGPVIKKKVSQLKVEIEQGIQNTKNKEI
ncbi:hypothetical protein [Psychromonas aquatilis]|uniref:Glycosyl transferase family 1 n=1 Tax=Psychromonas aquatilis TaxID=2005072 RepID=A0ABU9GT32_9GAMM